MELYLKPYLDRRFHISRVAEYEKQLKLKKKVIADYRN